MVQDPGNVPAAKHTYVWNNWIGGDNRNDLHSADKKIQDQDC